ncbi:MAG TPA: DUF6334 family protein [Chroococcidiopsis sp.]
MAHEFPIGEILTGVAVVEDDTFEDSDVCLDQVQLVFSNHVVTLNPIAETDEIAIAHTTPSLEAPSTPQWATDWVGKKLQTVWVCENAQGYHDQIIFAFDHLQPSIALIAEGSTLKLFRCAPIQKAEVVTVPHHHGHPTPAIGEDGTRRPVENPKVII